MQSNEILGLYLAAIHNLHFLLDMLRRIRQSILDGAFGELYAQYKRINESARQRIGGGDAILNVEVR